MQIIWRSRRGTKSATNNDAAAVRLDGEYALAIVVDASAQGRGQAFAQHWASSVVVSNGHVALPKDVAALKEAIRLKQRQLRDQHFVTEKASYCCALMDLRRGQVDILHTGDCRLAVQAASGEVTWLTQPHTLNRQLQLLGLAETLRSRHLRTSCLSPRRHQEPELLSFPLAQGDQLILCTDGYWYENFASAGTQGEDGDDASVLTLQTGQPSQDIQSDCENLFLSR